MALHEVLGLLSNAIRSGMSPGDVVTMIASAPNLSDAERDDLSGIPFERLNPYQHDIYMAERNMLVWGFSNTWQCLEQLRFGDPNTHGDECERAFVLRFKREYPCSTHSVREMGTLFIKYLSHDHAALCLTHPWILELAEAERLEVEVLYAEDSTIGRPMDTAARAVFFAQPVGMLLGTRIVRAERAHIGEYCYDITAIKRAVAALRDDRPLDFNTAPFTAAAAAIHLGIAREHETLEPTWYFADAADAAFLAATSEQNACTIQQHAEAVLHDVAPADATEAIQLSLYLQRLERALRLRYVLLAEQV